jgi:hypothetical protein
MLCVYDILALLSTAPAIATPQNARNNILSVGFQHLRLRGFTFLSILIYEALTPRCNIK